MGNNTEDKFFMRLENIKLDRKLPSLQNNSQFLRQLTEVVLSTYMSLNRARPTTKPNNKGQSK